MNITCKSCKENKPEEQFQIAKGNKTGRTGKCKKCLSDYDKTPKRVADRLARYAANPDRQWRNTLKHKFGLTVEQYNTMLLEQNGKCAVCPTKPTPEQRLDVDHDHACCPGKKGCSKCIRGLICRRCNVTLGLVKDDTKLLLSLVSYLN